MEKTKIMEVMNTIEQISICMTLPFKLGTWRTRDSQSSMQNKVLHMFMGYPHSTFHRAF